MFRDIPTRSSLWGDVEAQLPDLLHWATEFSTCGAARCEPLPSGRKAARDSARRARTAIKCSRLHPAKPSPEHLWTAGVLAGFGEAKLLLVALCDTRLPRALHDAGPWWEWACCKAQVSVRAFGSACETQGSCLTEVALSHSSLSTLLACSSSPGFCRELFRQAVLGVTLSVPAAPPGFSRASAQGTFWPNCSFILSRRLHGPKESQSL